MPGKQDSALNAGKKEIGQGAGSIQANILRITRIKVESVWSSNTFFSKRIIDLLKIGKHGHHFLSFFPSILKITFHL